MSLIAARLRDRGYDELAYEFEALTTELAAYKKDAERYRWLRHGDNDELVLVAYERHTEMTPPAYLPRSEELDAAIDAAAQPKEK